MADINTEMSGSLVYTVCAGDPPPTVATRTIADRPCHDRTTAGEDIYD